MTDQHDVTEPALRARVERWITGVRPEVLLERVATVFACALALVWFWELGSAHAFVALQPGPQEPNEPAVWYTTWLLDHGRNPYTVEEMPAAAYYFGPLYNLLVLATKPLLGIGYTAHRIFNAVFLVGTLWLLGSRMLRAGAGLGVTLLSAVVYYALCVDNIMITARPDTLGAFLLLLGILVPLERGYRPGPVAVGLACTVLAFHCKGYFGIGGAAILLGLAMHRSKREALLAGVGFAVGLAATIALCRYFFPLYLVLMIDVQWRTALVNSSEFHRAWQNTVLVEHFWPSLLLLSFALKDFVLRYPWREGFAYAVGQLRRLHMPLLAPALPVLGVFLLLNTFLIQNSLGYNQGATFTYYVHLLLPFLLLLTAGYTTTPRRRIAAMLMLIVVVQTMLHDFERIDGREPYAQLEARVAPHQKVLGIDIMADVLARQGKPLYTDGNTIYLPSGFGGGPWGRRRVHEELSERYDAMLHEIKLGIESRTLDLIVTHENDCQFSSMEPIRANYEQRGPEILMRYAFGGSRMQFWYPKSGDENRR